MRLRGWLIQSNSKQTFKVDVDNEVMCQIYDDFCYG